MKIEHYQRGFPYIIIQDLYTEEEEILIKKELDFYLPSLKGPDDTASARNMDTGELLKKNKGLFLDSVFSDRSVSRILEFNRKTFTLLEEEKKKIGHDNWFFKKQKTDEDHTLISYYEDGDYYLPHDDTALYTVLTWFYKEPKSFTGGDFVFPDYNVRIECKNNMTIIFPSIISHSVECVKVDEDKLNQGFGRWCLTQFAAFRDKKDIG